MSEKRDKEDTKMERPPMLMHWQNYYCENDHLPKAIYRLNITLTTPIIFFIEICSFCWCNALWKPFVFTLGIPFSDFYPFVVVV